MTQLSSKKTEKFFISEENKFYRIGYLINLLDVEYSIFYNYN